MYLNSINLFPNEYTLCIDDAVTEDYRFLLPEYAGIYFVFVGKAIENGDAFQMNNPRLIYIGESKNIFDRHNDENWQPKHEHHQDFINELKDGETIAYAFAKIDGAPSTRIIIESALIFHFDPVVNHKSTHTFKHRNTMITITSDDIDFPLEGVYRINKAL